MSYKRRSVNNGEKLSLRNKLSVVSLKVASNHEALDFDYLFVFFVQSNEKKFFLINENHSK